MRPEVDINMINFFEYIYIKWPLIQNDSYIGNTTDNLGELMELELSWSYFVVMYEFVY